MALSNNKVFSDKQEKLVARHVNGRQVSGSGARPFAPGDVESASWLFECKTHTTPGHSLSFKLPVWKKICDEASVRHKYPGYVVDDGSQQLDGQFVLFSRCSVDIDSMPKASLGSFSSQTITLKTAELSKTSLYTANWEDSKTVYIASLKYFEDTIVEDTY